jgi:predicted Rossmann-fold nucleotide-binding protein
VASIWVFCSSSDSIDSSYVALAVDLGRALEAVESQLAAGRRTRLTSEKLTVTLKN